VHVQRRAFAAGWFETALTSTITPSDSSFRKTSSLPLVKSSLILILSFVSAPRAPCHGSVFPSWHLTPLFTSANRTHHCELKLRVSSAEEWRRLWAHRITRRQVCHTRSSPGPSVD
jgi:hypothetical protein